MSILTKNNIAENIDTTSNYYQNDAEFNIKTANNTSNNQNINKNTNTINRKYILDFFNNNDFHVWSLNENERINFIHSKFLKLKELLASIKVIQDDFIFSDRQKFIIQNHLQLSEQELKDNFLKDISNNLRFKNYIIETYWNVYDVIEDYKQYKSECLFQQEYDIVVSAINMVLKVSSEIINS